MKDYKKFINNWLNDLETNVACEMEVNNINLNASKELLYKKDIFLN
jgi:hypothetical protein